MHVLCSEKKKRIIFYMIMGIAFIMIFSYNLLTPYLSDDISYKVAVDTAGSFWDLVMQQYGEYISNSGRIIGQFNVRLSLVGSKMIFNVVNSIMFIILSLLIYTNISVRKKYDALLYILIIGMLWRYSVKFGQTMLWICGACNYLWGSVFILGFITFYRSRLKKDEDSSNPVLLAIGTFLFGILAGWCNENTSGGGLLLILMFTVLSCINRKRAGKKTVLPYMITAHLGMCTGIIGMISAPGVRSRASAMSDDNYSGIVAYISRFYKCTMSIRELFFELLIIFIIVTILVVIKNQKKLPLNPESYLFFIGSIATAYALIMSPPPAPRAYFGAGIFLIIACLQGFTDAFWDTEKEVYTPALKYIVVSVLSLWLFFTYMDNLVNLARIYREEEERIQIIEEAREAGEWFVVVPQYREAFANPYSNAHESDMQEDPKYWINHFYETYYSMGEIIAIPREEWNELY